jgi:hypothetical protein
MCVDRSHLVKETFGNTNDHLDKGDGKKVHLRGRLGLGSSVNLFVDVATNVFDQ